MKEIIRIPYPKTAAGKKEWNKKYGMNAYYAGKHWSKRKEDADYWHQLTRAAMSKAQVRRRPFEKPVVITFLWNDKLDLDNHSIMSKMIIDALKGRLINDDTRRWVKGIAHYWSNEDYIKVIIQEIEPDEKD
jgi:hypothetical protein